VSWKNRRAILPAIQAIYRAENADVALTRLEELEAEPTGEVPRLCRGGSSSLTARS
jgi:hypothetical protein